MSRADIKLVRRQAWDAFACGDVDGVLRRFTHNCAGTPPASATAKAPATTTKTPQRSSERCSPTRRAELLDIRQAGDRLVALIRTHRPSEPDDRPPPHGELITVRDGKVTEMLSYPTVEARSRRPASTTAAAPDRQLRRPP